MSSTLHRFASHLSHFSQAWMYRTTAPCISTNRSALRSSVESYVTPLAGVGLLGDTHASTSTIGRGSLRKPMLKNAFNELAEHGTTLYATMKAPFVT